MRIQPFLLGIGLVVALLAAARMTAAVVVRVVDAEGTMVSKKEYIYKAEETAFTGTVVTNDLKGKTITIAGHNPLRRETVERIVPRDQAEQGKKGEKPPPVKDAAQVFRVDAFCRIALTNNPTAHMADIQGGDVVDVDFRKMADGSLIASAIRTAEKHPYDPSPAKTASKKK